MRQFSLRTLLLLTTHAAVAAALYSFFPVPALWLLLISLPSCRRTNVGFSAIEGRRLTLESGVKYAGVACAAMVAEWVLSIVAAGLVAVGFVATQILIAAIFRAPIHDNLLADALFAIAFGAYMPCYFALHWATMRAAESRAVAAFDDRISDSAETTAPSPAAHERPPEHSAGVTSALQK